MFFSAFSTLVLLPNLLLHYHPMTMKQLIFLIFAGMSAAGGQLSITTAYQNAPARDISVFDYSQVVYAAIFGLILFGEIPDVWSIAGTPNNRNRVCEVVSFDQTHCVNGIFHRMICICLNFLSTRTEYRHLTFC